MKTTFKNCPTCDTKNTVKIETEPITSNGFTVTIHICANCESYHTLDDNYNLIKYTPNAKEINQK